LIEQLSPDAKSLLGLDSAEVMTESSVLRHAIFTFALATWMRIWAYKCLSQRPSPPTSPAGQLAESRMDILRQTIIAAIPDGKVSK